jgi:hypothetical protein
MAATLRPWHPPSLLYFSTPLISPLQRGNRRQRTQVRWLTACAWRWGAAAPWFDGAADLSTKREQKADEWPQLELVVMLVHIILWFFGQHMILVHDVRESTDTYMIYDQIFTVHTQTHIRHFNLLYIQADRGFAADSIYQYYFNCIITADSNFS